MSVVLLLELELLVVGIVLTNYKKQSKYGYRGYQGAQRYQEYGGYQGPSFREALNIFIIFERMGCGCEVTALLILILVVPIIFILGTLLALWPLVIPIEVLY